MAKKLFIGGLSWGTVDASLREAFEVFGEVSEARVVTDRETGRSRGFGFVTMAEDEDGDKAIAALDGKPLEGRAVKVSEALDRGGVRHGPRPSDGGGLTAEYLGQRGGDPMAGEFGGFRGYGRGGRAD